MPKYKKTDTVISKLITKYGIDAVPHLIEVCRVVKNYLA